MPLSKERLHEDDVVAALRRGFGDETTERFLSDEPDGLRIPNALTTLMHHPSLAGPFLAYNNLLLFSPTLEPRLRELMVLRVAWRTRSKYEWVQHFHLAQRYGVTTEEVDAIAQGADTDAWEPLEAAVLAATDELIDHYRIADDTWGRLAAELDERELVELVFVVGTYTTLAMAFKSFGLELDPGLDDSGAPPLPESDE